MTSLYGILANHINESAAMIICFAICIIVPYLLGSVNFALVISKVFYRDDIRKYGSGNAGMTNMLRTFGKAAAAGTLICDMLKAVLSVIIGQTVCPVFGIGGYMAGFFCVLGHIFPIFFKFKGGKGVATMVAMVLTLDPVCFLILITVFIAVVAATKYVSLGSVIMCMLFPIFTYKLALAGLSGYGIGFSVIFSFLTSVFVIFMHRENIKRLKNHTENKISFSKKGKDKK